ncbi:amino acid ABC transporter ATP-binding protein [Oscillospiraceae bacterium LTW-04]|nr:amino acid ABC transporter ATP-binding protein [Oscillospiraceae bacterium MB24-C1]
MSIIEVRNLKKSFGDVRVLDGVSFSVEKGEAIAVIGPSGSGKSTMLRCLIGLERADGGDIIIEGDPLMQNGVYVGDAQMRKACAKMGMVFQSFNLFPHMTVLNNLIAAPTIVRKEDKTEATERARTLLSDVGLLDKANVYPSALSGGQKQRVAIARALMMNPDLLLFDEPTSSLDPQLTAEVLAVMKKLVKKRMTMIVVTHEMGFAREAADKVMFMCDCNIVEMGTTKEVFDHPKDPRIREFIQSIL